MITKLATKLCLSLVALGFVVAPALAATDMTAMPATPAHKAMPATPAHKAMHAKAGKPAMEPKLSATDQLNAQSLAAAQAGKEYMAPPAAAPAAPMKKKI